MFVFMKRLFFIAVSATILFAACKKDDDDNGNNINTTDRNFLINGSHGNIDEVDAGGLASTKSDNDGVQMFGSMMVDDHTTAQMEMKMVADSFGVAVPNEPDSAHKVMKTKLMSLSGMAFDTTYIRAQIMDHQSTIALMQDEISHGQADRVKRYAGKYLPKVQMHLVMADSLMRVLQQP